MNIWKRRIELQKCEKFVKIILWINLVCCFMLFIYHCVFTGIYNNALKRSMNFELSWQLANHVFGLLSSLLGFVVLALSIYMVTRFFEVLYGHESDISNLKSKVGGCESAINIQGKTIEGKGLLERMNLTTEQKNKLRSYIQSNGLSLEKNGKNIFQQAGISVTQSQYEIFSDYIFKNGLSLRDIMD